MKIRTLAQIEYVGVLLGKQQQHAEIKIRSSRGNAAANSPVKIATPPMTEPAIVALSPTLRPDDDGDADDAGDADDSDDPDDPGA